MEMDAIERLTFWLAYITPALWCTLPLVEPERYLVEMSSTTSNLVFSCLRGECSFNGWPSGNASGLVFC